MCTDGIMFIVYYFGAREIFRKSFKVENNTDILRKTCNYTTTETNVCACGRKGHFYSQVEGQVRTAGPQVERDCTRLPPL